MSNDLEARVENRKRELISEILHHKKNSSRFGASEEIRKLTRRLAELAEILDGSVLDGLDKLGPRTRLRLDSWMAR